MRRIGVISDTHGLLRPEAAAFLAGSDHIIHAGDIGAASILDELRAIAPVTAVRGNNDRDDWATRLPHTAQLDVEGIIIHVVHDIAEFDPSTAKGARVIVSGHSHKPHIEQRAELLYVNPGSAGRRRFKLPIAAADLRIDKGEIIAQVSELRVL